jgi:hypothetical protein
VRVLFGLCGTWVHLHGPDGETANLGQAYVARRELILLGTNISVKLVIRLTAAQN